MAASDGGAVTAAARRLETALAMLEQRLARRMDEAGAGAVSEVAPRADSPANVPLTLIPRAA